MADVVAPDCRVCVKRFETSNPRAPLQCRALPPVQDLGRDAIFPTVGDSAYCHLHFELDTDALKARKAAQADTEKLDAKVAATQAAAVPAQPELALEPGMPGKDMPKVHLPPAGEEPPTQGVSKSRARRAPAAKAGK